MVVGTYENSVMGRAAVTLEDENMLCITVGPLGWKHELENVNGNDFLFESDGPGAARGRMTWGAGLKPGPGDCALITLVE